MSTLLRLSPWLLLAGMISPVSADEVVLKNGAKLQGAVTEEDGKVTIDVGSGTITIDRSQVKSISKSDDLNQEYDRRVKEAKPDDPEAHYQVYLWTRQQEGLKSRGERQLRKVLEIDPNHERARRAMGYVNHKGAWLTQDEYRATLGIVRYNGEWVTSETAERLRKIDEQLRVAQMKQDADSQKLRDQLEIERNRIALRQRALEMLEMGEFGNPFNPSVAPWGLRYWGPAGVGNQPTAD